MKKSPNGFVLPLLLIVIAILAAGGTYVYEKNKQTDQQVTASSTSQTTSSTQTSSSQTTAISQPVKEVSADELLNSRLRSQTIDWKTYTNTQYGFSFKYPSELTLSERPGSTWTNVDLKKSGFQLTFFAGERNIGGYIGYGTVWTKKISIDGKLLDETLTKCEGNDVMLRIANANFNGQTRYDRFESECFDQSLVDTFLPRIELIAQTLKYSI